MRPLSWEVYRYICVSWFTSPKLSQVPYENYLHRWTRESGLQKSYMTERKITQLVENEVKYFDTKLSTPKAQVHTPTTSWYGGNLTLAVLLFTFRTSVWFCLLRWINAYLLTQRKWWNKSTAKKKTKWTCARTNCGSKHSKFFVLPSSNRCNE